MIHGRAPLRQIVTRDGHGVPLREALAATAPRAYSLNLPNAGAWADTPVSWHGHRSFAEVLKEILADRPDLVADVDTDLRLVTITKQSTSFESPRPAQGTLAGMSSSAEGHSRSDTNVALSSAGQPQMLERTHAPVLDRASQDTFRSAANLIAKQPPVLAWSGAGATTSLKSADTSAVSTGAARKRVAATATATAAARETEIAPPLLAAQTQPQTQPAQLPISDAPNVAPAESPSVRAWTIDPADRTIRIALARWASEAGWQFVWDVPTDFAVDASATINGTLEDALNAVAQALKRSQVPIQVILYKGNKVIRVVGEGAA